MGKTIGILGGMGPLATADLFRKIVTLTDAHSDGEHIRVYIDSNSQIPDRTAAILQGGADPMPQMRDALKHLLACGADCIIMPCNTAHYFLPRLQAESERPILSMLEATAKACAQRYAGRTAGILATRGTLASGLYQKALEAEGVAYCLPEEPERDTLMQVIYEGVKKGAPLEPMKEAFAAMLEAMQARGADYFILGCTELPLAFEQLRLPYASVDATEELACAAIRFCGYAVKK